MISIDNVSVYFGSYALFDNVSFVVNPKDRIGLVGKNGAGKSTLLKLIKGTHPSSSGAVTIPVDCSVGYLPQHMKHDDKHTLMNEAKKAFDYLLDLQKELDFVNNELVTRTDYESEAYHKIIERTEELNTKLQYEGIETMDQDVEKTLLGLGFKRSDFDRNTSEFSGGWRMRIELAKILLQKPNLILLDEPTNHLDIESIQWVESFLVNYPGAIILVSHDRSFLDNITKRTIEISLSKIYDYKASYTRYTVLRQERREQQLAAYRNQQKTIEETEKFIARFRYQATKANQVQSRVKQLDRLVRLEVEEEDNSSMNIKFPSSVRSGNMVVEARNVTKIYDEHVVLQDIDLDIERGEKIAFVGRNGEGKTTLVKIIKNELEHSGSCRTGHNVEIGYFAQNIDSIFDDNKTVLQTVDDVAVGDIRTKVRNMLGSFLFSGEDVEKKVSVLSGGERNRLAMVVLMLKPVNFLILDEPTNHLDMRSKEILKEALKNYDGTLIIVSHDRDFLHGLTDKLYEFGNKKIKEFKGDINDFLAMKKFGALNEIELKNKKKVTPVEEEIKTVSNSKKQYEKRKSADKEIRKFSSKVEKSEARIARLETEIENMDGKMHSGETVTDPAFYVIYEDTKKRLEIEMSTWEQLQEDVDTLTAKRDAI